MEVIYPPDLPDRYLYRPVIFLAGPIQNAPNWQASAIEILMRLAGDKEILIANPRRNIVKEENFTNEQHKEQVDWEHLWLNLAGTNGVKLFWLAKPETENPKRAYAQTTRFELGEAMAMSRCRSHKVVVGIESGFSGERYIRHTFSQKCPTVKICSSLEETCLTAIGVI